MTSFNKEGELLLRQVHPNFIVEDRITSQVFLPTAKDEHKLSVNRDSMISPQAAYELHTLRKQLKSAGVWGVSVEETRALEPLFIESDPLEAPYLDPSHCLINFSKLPSESRAKAIAKQLTAKARDRGCLYQSDEDG